MAAANPVVSGASPSAQIDCIRIFHAPAEFPLLKPCLHRSERSRQADEDDENQNSLQPEQDVVQDRNGAGGVVGGNRDDPHSGHDHKEHGGVLGPRKWIEW